MVSYRKRRAPRSPPRLTHRKTDAPPNGTNDGTENETERTTHDGTTRRDGKTKRDYTGRIPGRETGSLTQDDTESGKTGEKADGKRQDIVSISTTRNGNNPRA